MRLCTVVTTAGFSLLAAAGALAQSISFELIPFALGANDLSPDGRYVVGEADWDGDGWSDGSYLRDFVTGEVIDLGNTVDPTTSIPVVAVSDDGQVALGTMPNPEEPNNPLGDVAGMWHADTQAWESLGYLPNAGYCPGRSSGYELSADGSVAVGLSWDDCNGLAVRWTQATGMVALEELAFGANRASVVSADGSVIAGFAQGSQSRTPAVWYANGAGELLDPSAFAVGEVHGISDDGTILLGEWTTNEATTRATKWTLGPDGWEREQIANGSILPGWGGIPEDIADDGTIVGFDFLLGYRRAWIVPPGSATVLEFKPYIEAHGATVPSGMTLEVCQAISTDGRFIVGHGFGTGAWRVTILPDCPADTTRDGAVDLADLSQVLTAYGTCAGDAAFDPAADLNADLCVNLADLSELLTEYGTMCP